jgi:hypothetical protein
LERHASGGLVRLAEASERDLFGDCRLIAARCSSGMPDLPDSAVDGAGSKGVDADIVISQAR